jgi:hypothetical protein
MDFKSLNEYVKFNRSEGVYNLFVSTFQYNQNISISLSEYVVGREDDMT